MKRIALIVVLVSALGLVGCDVSDINGLDSPDLAVGPQFTVSIVGPLTVALDGTASGPGYYIWDLGDGSPKQEGRDLAIIGYTYEKPGIYVISLEIQEEGGGYDDGGGCAVCPGGGGSSGSVGSTSKTYRVADLRGCEDLHPTITMINFIGNVVPNGGSFLGWTKVTFAASVPGASDPENEFVYRWTVELTVFYDMWSPPPKTSSTSLNSESDEGSHTPIWEPHTFKFLSSDKNFSIDQIPGPGGCISAPPAEGTVTLEVWSPKGCYKSVQATFFVSQ